MPNYILCNKPSEYLEISIKMRIPTGQRKELTEVTVVSAYADVINGNINNIKIHNCTVLQANIRGTYKNDLLR